MSARNGQVAHAYGGIYLFWPETSGRHLEEVDEIFIQSQNIFQPVRISKTLPRGRLTAAVDDTAEKGGIEQNETAASPQICIGDGEIGHATS